jgi:hypothetical protein
MYSYSKKAALAMPYSVIIFSLSLSLLKLNQMAEHMTITGEGAQHDWIHLLSDQ